MRSTERSRKMETIISRLGFGHTGLNRAVFKIVQHSTKRCDFCGQAETLVYVMSIYIFSIGYKTLYLRHGGQCVC